ncbi:mammalian cell entry protein [Massilia sp. Root133]|uniref:Mammalian cell entry protein n=1 Tax=Massilia cellulosiltytica TaxID=2683234 RepID=A0A7X3FYM4_9BURK|nr:MULTISPECIES: MlaD family protein [Telluria group]KQX98387.1 mammalian cell entry protein [Massilia sp. Root133]KQZ47073.1 mammalian cell entry protein [Massilia sp. Root1485]MVW59457.1 mammalian cell entry protein [Telluria cellulosilytica]
MSDKDTPPDEPKHVEAKALFLLVLIGALIVAFFLYVMYARGVFEKTQELVLVADDSSGVIPGMDMTFAGFPIGRVRQVELGKDGKVNILVDIAKNDAKWLRTTSVFTLESSVVGETRLRAYSGVLTDPPLPDHAQRPVLRGDAAAEIPRLMATARTLLENLETMTRADSHIGNTLANVDALSGRLSGRYGVLGTALGGDAEAEKLLQTLHRVDALLAKTDQRVFGKKGVMDDAQSAIRELNGLLADARGTLQKADGVLAEAQAVAKNAHTATDDLGRLRGEVDASLRKVNRLVDEINRKWPFRQDTEVKLP